MELKFKRYYTFTFTGLSLRKLGRIVGRIGHIYPLRRRLGHIYPLRKRVGVSSGCEGETKD